MIKILHSADWHLDSPFQGRTEEQAQLLRRELLQVPGKIAQLCRDHRCDLVLLSGDLFDGAYSADSLQAVYAALQEMSVPVFITPGNHDFTGTDSPWLTEHWPENVHIFTKPLMESVELRELGCRIYGAGFTAMDCDALLEGFCAAEDMTAIGILHGDPTQANSPYCPISKSQVADSGFAYLALGHIHKGDQFRAGNTLCAWPGCPMGRGYDEQGEKGVLIVTVEDTAEAKFYPLDTPRFYDWEAPVSICAESTLESLLPPVGNDHFYRITFTGECETPDLEALSGQYIRFPNLLLRDKTLPPLDIWRSVGEDSFEGTYFGMLQQALEAEDEAGQEKILLAARICRQILDGREVVLP
ncbi:MAG: metallophosphoesterase [Oscillospiraceae bacterium]|nr:metallophosphoesterase [Oscillospiraceae bacterium]